MTHRRNANTNADADAVQCNAMRCSNADAKVKPMLVFAVVNSTGEMRAMHVCDADVEPKC